MDFEVLEEELEDGFRHKAKAWNKSQAQKDAYVESATRKEILRMRRHKLARCETGAMLRAIRGLLTIKNSYTKEELEKPFVIARLAFQPDYNDPEIRKEFVAAATQAITGIYGSAQTSPFPQKAEGTFPKDIKTVEVVVEEIDDDIPGAEEEPSEPEEDSAMVDFKDQDRDGQVKTLAQLGKKKGYNFKNLKKPLEKFTEDQRLEFFTALKDMPEDDDIPY